MSMDTETNKQISDIYAERSSRYVEVIQDEKYGICIDAG